MAASLSPGFEVGEFILWHGWLHKRVYKYDIFAIENAVKFVFLLNKKPCTIPGAGLLVP